MGVDAHCEIGRRGIDGELAGPMNAYPFHAQDGVDSMQRPALPQGDLVDDSRGNGLLEIAWCCRTGPAPGEELAELPGIDTSRVERQYGIIKAIDRSRQVRWISLQRPPQRGARHSADKSIGTVQKRARDVVSPEFGPSAVLSIRDRSHARAPPCACQRARRPQSRHGGQVASVIGNPGAPFGPMAQQATVAIRIR